MATIFSELYNLSPRIEEFDYQEIVDRFGENRGRSELDSTKFFNMQWKPFAWAAIIGFKEDKSIPIEGKTKSIFKYSVIHNNGVKIFDALVLFAIAKKGYEVLKTPSDVNRTIEEYANGGFEIIHSLRSENREYFDREEDFLDFLLSEVESLA